MSDALKSAMQRLVDYYFSQPGHHDRRMRAVRESLLAHGTSVEDAGYILHQLVEMLGRDKGSAAPVGGGNTGGAKTYWISDTKVYSPQWAFMRRGYIDAKKRLGFCDDYETMREYEQANYELGRLMFAALRQAMGQAPVWLPHMDLPVDSKAYDGLMNAGGISAWPHVFDREDA